VWRAPLRAPSSAWLPKEHHSSWKDGKAKIDATEEPLGRGIAADQGLELIGSNIASA